MRVNNKGFTRISKGNHNDEGSDYDKTSGTKRARVTKRARAMRVKAEPSLREKGDDGFAGGKGTQQSTTKAISTARNVVATTARATTKAARATAAGATRTTAVFVATMTPNGDEDN